MLVKRLLQAPKPAVLHWAPKLTPGLAQTQEQTPGLGLLVLSAPALRPQALAQVLWPAQVRVRLLRPAPQQAAAPLARQPPAVQALA